METYNRTQNSRIYRVGVGLLILLIGLNFLLKNFGFYTFDWLFSWHTFLFVLGLIIGVKRNFRGGGWLALVLIGGYFTLQDLTGHAFGRFAFPIGLTIFGLYLILSPKGDRPWRRRSRNYVTDFTTTNPADPNAAYHGAATDPRASTQGQYMPPDTDDQFVIDSVNVFSGAHQNIVSKNLKGGEIVSVFGGCDLNLTQSNFEGTIVIEVIAIFGGVKIILPPTWEVKNEVTAIFGGIDDKRALMPYQGEVRKVVVLKGIALFGGVDIRNF
jgi:predicted membrane protein